MWELQRRVDRATNEPTDRQRPRHLHLAQRRGLEVELERAGRACRDLGRLASLANHMVAQALCSLSHLLPQRCRPAVDEKSERNTRQKPAGVGPCRPGVKVARTEAASALPLCVVLWGLSASSNLFLETI
ncbi:hypothetical protein CRUP_029322 [Coryphaenoides rupestris]|nr:hypothetical protein CRUP_029322 [Coryphaenoides rupestris]